MLMVQRPVIDGTGSLERRPGEKLQTRQRNRPSILQTTSDPTLLKTERWSMISKQESKDTLPEPFLTKVSPISRLQIVNSQQSASTCPQSPNSRPNSSAESLRPSPPSSTTSVNVAVDVTPDLKPVDTSRRPSLLTRLRSSISTSGWSASGTQKASVQPSDFSQLPEQPEIHFIDGIGMVIPGVCNRSMCAHPLAHFITNWRLCEPIEYTTALADHGITYSDYSKLVTVLANFLDEIPNEPKRKTPPLSPWWHMKSKKPTGMDEVSMSIIEAPAVVPKHNSVSESTQQLKIATQQASRLNLLLEDISWHWQQRGIPVMVCVGSYSLFTPNRISEAFIQLVHTSRKSASPIGRIAEALNLVDRLSDIDPFVKISAEEPSVAPSRHKLKRSSSSPPGAPKGTIPHHHQHSQPRDRSKPWPLWPNAIPSHKREWMNGHADRYGVDPYFRAWTRAHINSRTRCTSYAKFMIEKEDNPFINTRLAYVTPPSKRKLIWDFVTTRPTRGDGQRSSTVNRGVYEHNRRLECRKTVEHGSRLRIARFCFRHPLYPVHTPEMEELGLTSEAYQNIINKIEEIRSDHTHVPPDCPIRRMIAWRRFRRLRAEHGLAKVSEYIRKVNASDRRLVWTIEKIPGAYNRSFGRVKPEWEISVWNGEDPLALLIQLENWGIIEKKLNINDDE